MNDKTYTAAGFARAEFARHPDGHIAARGAATADFPWLCEDGNFSDDGMVEEGWSPVRECPNPEQHRHGVDWQAVAERQEEELGDAIRAHTDTLAMARLWKATARRAIQVRAEALRFAGRANDQANDAVEMLARRGPRPLAPDDITDGMVKRGVGVLLRCWPNAQSAGRVPGIGVRELLTAALTVPTRPEGAEEIEAILAGSWPIDREGLSAAADDLAMNGVRAEGDR